MTAEKESEISRLEDKILAEGRKLRAVAEREALKLRQSKIGEELKAIEAALARLEKVEKPAEKPVEKPAEKKAAKKDEDAAKSSDDAAAAKKS